MVDSVAALMDGLILWWFFGCDGGSIHCMWLGCLVLFCRRELYVVGTVCGRDVWFCFAGVKHGGKVEEKKLIMVGKWKKKINYFIIF